MTHQVLDLSQGKVVAATLFPLDNGVHILAILLHHAVADGWSISILHKELSEAYKTKLQGKTIEWKPLPIQYSDYAVWQREHLSSATIAREETYWKMALAGVQPFLQLPLDMPRPEQPEGNAGKYIGTFNSSVLKGAKQYADSLGVNLQSVLLAAVQLLLMKYAAQDDIVIGVPTAGRERVETHELIGYFANTVAVRGYAQEGTTVEDMVLNASSTTLAALENSHLPFNRVVELAHVTRTPGANPLIQALCQYTPQTDIPMPDFTGLNVEMQKVELSHAKFDLAFHFGDTEEFVIEYMAELFEKSTIAGMAQSLAFLLEESLRNMHLCVFKLQMLGQQDMLLLQDFGLGNIRVDYMDMPLVHHMFEERAAAEPGKTCLIFGNQQLTYAEVNARANQLARKLLEIGVQREFIVAVMLERSFELVISILAVLKAGAAYLPLDPSYPDERLAIYVEDAGASVVLTQSSLFTQASKLAEHKAKILIVERLDVTARPSININGIEFDPEATSLILFTSGSTGRYVRGSILACILCLIKINLFIQLF